MLLLIKSSMAIISLEHKLLPSHIITGCEPSWSAQQLPSAKASQRAVTTWVLGPRRASCVFHTTSMPCMSKTSLHTPCIHLPRSPHPCPPRILSAPSPPGFVWKKALLICRKAATPTCIRGPLHHKHILVVFINTKGNGRGWMNNSSTFSKSSHTRK